MINLTRLNGVPVTVNADVIKFVEAVPDTKITFLNGDIVLVKEPVGDVVAKVKVYKKEILRGE